MSALLAAMTLLVRVMIALIVELVMNAMILYNSLLGHRLRLVNYVLKNFDWVWEMTQHPLTLAKQHRYVADGHLLNGRAKNFVLILFFVIYAIRVPIVHLTGHFHVQ